MPYCPQCGRETEPEAAFCGTCGVGLEEQTPPLLAPRSATRGTWSLWSVLGGVVVLGALTLGVVALYDAAANDGEWGESLFGDGGEQLVVAAPTLTPGTTPQPSPTLEPPQEVPTPTLPQEEPTATPIVPVYLTPEEAINAYMVSEGLPYVGDCDTASLETDLGSYCSVLWEDSFDTRIYFVGLAFTDQTVSWLLVSRLGARDDWQVVDVAEYLGAEEPPPWP